MKVLVTGGAGYLGAVVVEELIAKGYNVRVIDKLYFGKEPLNNYLKRIELVQGDIRNFDKNVLEGVGAVIHLAGLSNDPTAESNPKANMEMNRDATKILAQACIEKGIKKFIFASSASIYDKGIKGSDEMQDEESKVDPKAAYSISKYEAERELIKLSQQNENFCPVILRQGTVYGQSSRMRYDLVINTLVKKTFTDGKLKVFCGGNQWRPLVDVRDVARAHIACLEAPEEKVKGEIFNVSFGNFQILNLAHMVKHALKNIVEISEIDVDYDTGRIDRSYKISNKKIEETLGFRHRVSIEESVKNMAENIKRLLESGKIKKTDLNNLNYYNIGWMEFLVEMENKLKEMGGSVF